MQSDERDYTHNALTGIKNISSKKRKNFKLYELTGVTRRIRQDASNNPNTIH
jgi:hypothetical protein